MRRWAFATACGFASRFQIGAENGDIVGSHQSLWADYQSETRIESHRETMVGKGGSLDWAGCSKRLSSKAAADESPGGVASWLR